MSKFTNTDTKDLHSGNTGLKGQLGKTGVFKQFVIDQAMC